MSGGQPALVGKPRYGGLSEATVERTEADAPLRLEIPFSIEGERVQVTMAEAVSRRAAPLISTLTVLDASSDRVPPGCKHFGTCGGCQYQHMVYPRQLATKTEVLQQLLQQAGITAPAPQVHAAEPWVYRNRMRLRVQGDRVGYSRRASHDFLAIEECPIVSPLLWRAALQLVALVAERRAAWPLGTAEVELFADSGDTALQLAVHVDAEISTLDRDAPAALRTLCAALQARVPELVGGGLLAQVPAAPGLSRRVRERQRVEVARWGEPGMVYRVNDREYPVSRGAFFQVNRFLAGTLVDLVMGNRQGELALDLFAGAGLFSLPLTERFRTVMAVEVGQPAATDLHRLLKACGRQHGVLAQTTLAFLKQWNTATGVPDLVVLDPPRAGVGDDAMHALLRLKPPEIVYVSCDPTSFVREAKALVNSGYAVAELHMLDLFPQTFHMETVAVFRRA